MQINMTNGNGSEELVQRFREQVKDDAVKEHWDARAQATCILRVQVHRSTFSPEEGRLWLGGKKLAIVPEFPR